MHLSLRYAHAHCAQGIHSASRVYTEALSHPFALKNAVGTLPVLLQFLIIDAASLKELRCICDVRLEVGPQFRVCLRQNVHDKYSRTTCAVLIRRANIRAKACVVTQHCRSYINDGANIPRASSATEFRRCVRNFDPVKRKKTNASTTDPEPPIEKCIHLTAGKAQQRHRFTSFG